MVNAYLPGILLYCLADLQRRFLNNFGLNHIAFYPMILGALLHAIWCEIFVIQLSMGITGLGIANVITQLIILIVLIILT